MKIVVRDKYGRPEILEECHVSLLQNPFINGFSGSRSIKGRG